MKRKYLLTLVLALAMALAACANSAPIKTAPTTPAAAAEPTAQPEAKPAAEPTAQPAQEPSGAERPRVRVAAMKGPTAMGMVGLMKENEEGNTLNDYEFSLAGAADEITAKLAKDELDIAALPCNVSSVLYNKTNSIKLLAVNTLGVLYILENGNTVSSVADLKGQTISLMGKGTTPEFSLNHILKQSGLDPKKDVKLVFKSEAAEIAALLDEGAVKLAMLPEPYVTTVMAKNPDLRVALDISEEWALLGGENGGALVTGTVIVRDGFLAQNKAAVDDFLKEYKNSVQYVQGDVDGAAELVKQYGIVGDANIARRALPNCNIVFIDGEEMISDVSKYLQALLEQNPQSVGGKLPDEAFYYMD